MRPPLTDHPSGLIKAFGAEGPLNHDAPVVERRFEGRPVDHWLWLHLDHNAPAAREWIAGRSNIPDHAATVLLAEHTRPRCDVRPEGILFVGRGVNLNPESDPEDMVSIRAWLDDRGLTTVVLRRVRAVEDVADECAQSSAIHSPATILVRLLEHLLTRMNPVILDLGEELDEVQEAVIDEHRTVPTSRIADLRMRALILHRYLVPLRDAIAELRLAGKDRLGAENASRLREALDRVTRLTEDLAAAQSKASLARDEVVSQASERLSTRVYRLTHPHRRLPPPHRPHRRPGHERRRHPPRQRRRGLPHRHGHADRPRPHRHRPRLVAPLALNLSSVERPSSPTSAVGGTGVQPVFGRRPAPCHGLALQRVRPSVLQHPRGGCY